MEQQGNKVWMLLGFLLFAGLFFGLCGIALEALVAKARGEWKARPLMRDNIIDLTGRKKNGRD